MNTAAIRQALGLQGELPSTHAAGPGSGEKANQRYVFGGLESLISMAYRSDLQALESRMANLEDELGEVRRKLADVPPLEERQAELVSSLVEARKGIAELRAAEMRVAIKVARPCPANWDAMQGDDRVRFCSSCRKDVYNLSAMSAGEALALIQEREGNLCARFYRRGDGTVLTSDCSVGRQRTMLKRIGIAAGIALASSAAYSAFGSAAMGEMVMQGAVSVPAVGQIAIEPPDASAGEELATEATSEEDLADQGPPAKEPQAESR